jgi:23S rRNA (uridine2552-2'-O)-methyltransferase
VAAYTRKDAPYRAAKRAGLRSRAAPKLVDLDKKFRLFRKGMRVLDLGCWPGGWLQIAAEAVGESGRVVGVDIEPCEDLGRANVASLVGDINDDELAERLSDALGGAEDLLLSDLAPKLSGVKVADRERHMRLAERAVELADRLLADDGIVLMKMFSGVETEVTHLLKQRVGKVVKHRPESTRKGSSEIYAVAYKRGAAR